MRSLQSKLISFKILVVVVLTLGAFGCGGGGGGGDGGGNACGDLNIRVVNGTQCSFERSPVVAVIPLGVNGEQLTTLGICTGTMVTVNDVLTAAHCVTVPGAAGYAVIVDQSIFPVTGGAIHPLYDGSVVSPFDVAMLTLNTVLDISPVPLLLTDDIAIGESISVFGYGDDETGSNALEQGLDALKGARMTIGDIIPGIFAATFDQSGTSICQGDSGGPVTQNPAGVTGIVGVTSFTAFGCQAGSISGFVDMQIAANVDFVRGYAPDIPVI